MKAPLKVGVTKGIRGWFAVLIDTSEGYPEAVQTGSGSYATESEARSEARAWADAEGIETEFIDTN
jgi:hypothetical protein